VSLWTPAEITTALWLDAADSGTLTLDGSGNVEQWDDKSGNGRHATQSTAGSRPEFDGSGSELLFNGSSHFLECDDLASVAAGDDKPWTFFAVTVAENHFLSHRNIVSFGADPDSLNGFHHQLRYTSAGTPQSDRRAGAASQQVAGSFDIRDTSVILGKVFTGSLGSLFVNGDEDASGSQDVDSMGESLNLFTIGARRREAGVDRHFPGSISEIVFLGEAADTKKRQLVEGYLAWKWGLEEDLPSGHPYKDAAPMLSGIAGNARFRELTAAALVVARSRAGIEIARATPEASPLGDYFINTSQTGPLLLTAHAFDPEDWQGIWQADTVYAEGDVVFSNGATNDDSLVLECTAATGSTESGSTEPVWDSVVGETTADNDLTWTTLGTIAELAPITNFYVAS
jgi:hypothetical protein